MAMLYLIRLSKKRVFLFPLIVPTLDKAQNINPKNQPPLQTPELPAAEYNIAKLVKKATASMQNQSATIQMVYSS
jgi:hypothetical protein